MRGKQLEDEHFAVNAGIWMAAIAAALHGLVTHLPLDEEVAR